MTKGAYVTFDINKNVPLLLRGGLSDQWRITFDINKNVPLLLRDGLRHQWSITKGWFDGTAAGGASAAFVGHDGLD